MDLGDKMKKSELLRHTLIMTAVNLIMRSIGVYFNAYLTSKIGSVGIGLFQLVMTVYSLAATFSCAGIRLATTRISVEANTLKKNDITKSLTLCIIYAGICGSIIGFILYGFSDFISLYWIDSPQTSFPLKILSLSLPFVAMSASLGGYFTAIGHVPHYSCVQLLEQAFKIIVVISLISKPQSTNPLYSCISIVTGMTASEVFSFIMATVLKKLLRFSKTDKQSITISKIMRIAIPDAVGTCARSILLTIEHLLIPKGFKKSGANGDAALASYGNIHAMAMPVLLYPSAVLSSLSALLIPNLAEYNELGEKDKINSTVSRNLKRSLFFSMICALFFFLFSTPLCKIIYKSSEAAKYVKILSPLVPVMYMDTVTDGMLKGLDQQVYSMRYNIIDSTLCVILVWIVLPKYSVKGYIFILYISEVLNFVLSVNRLRSVCKIKFFQAHEEENSKLFRSMKC